MATNNRIVKIALKYYQFVPEKNEMTDYKPDVAL
jgi:Tfp pilus assembly major pilin PilA